MAMLTQPHLEQCCTDASASTQETRLSKFWNTGLIFFGIFRKSWKLATQNFVKSKKFEKKGKTCIQQGDIKSINSDSKLFYTIILK